MPIVHTSRTDRLVCFCVVTFASALGQRLRRASQGQGHPLAPLVVDLDLDHLVGLVMGAQGQGRLEVLAAPALDLGHLVGLAMEALVLGLETESC